MLSLDRWNPFEEISDLQRDINRAFGWSGTPTKGALSWLPPAEVTSGSEGWTIRMGLPGIDPKDVSVDLDKNVLTVSGERTTPEEKNKRHLSELGYGRFTRSFTLPDTVDTEKVAAKFEHGMLELTLPVTEVTKPRRIEIAA
jgi:HSP20 family protein